MHAEYQLEQSVCKQRRVAVVRALSFGHAHAVNNARTLATTINNPGPGGTTTNYRSLARSVSLAIALRRNIQNEPFHLIDTRLVEKERAGSGSGSMPKGLGTTIRQLVASKHCACDGNVMDPPFA